MASLQLKVSGDPLKMAEQVKLLRLPVAKKRKLARKIGNEVRKRSRRRLREQKDLHGQPFAKRRSGGRQKMLRKMGRGLRVYPGADGVTITYPNPLVGRTARAQQEGLNEQMTAKRMAKIHGKGGDDSATRRQAKALRDEGFVIRLPGGKRKRPTLKWIVENYTKDQAGVVLRSMREKASEASWNLPGTPRSFLGASQQDINAVTRIVLDEMT